VDLWAKRDRCQQFPSFVENPLEITPSILVANDAASPVGTLTAIPEWWHRRVIAAMRYRRSRASVERKNLATQML